MINTDRFMTAFFAILAAGASLFGYNTATSEPPAPTTRWSTEAVLTIDSDSPLAGPAFDALSQWDVPMRVAFAKGDAANIRVLLLDPANPQAGGEATKTAEGGFFTGCTIKVSTTLQQDLVMPTLTHEMGHCLGLHHTQSGEPSNMYFSMAGWETGVFSFEITDYDLALMTRLYS